MLSKHLKDLKSFIFHNKTKQYEKLCITLPMKEHVQVFFSSTSKISSHISRNATRFMQKHIFTWDSLYIYIYLSLYKDNQTLCKIAKLNERANK